MKKSNEASQGTTTTTQETTTQVAPTTSKPSQSTSLINQLLLYLSLIGLGIIVGYLLFYTIYNHRCADLLDDAEGRYNQTRANLETQYQTALEEHHECIGDESANLEIYDLRGRLEKLETIQKDYEILKEKHSKTLEELTNKEALLEEKISEQSKLQKEYNKKSEQFMKGRDLLVDCRKEKTAIEKLADDNKAHLDNVIESKTKELGMLEHQFEDCKRRLEVAVLRKAKTKSTFGDEDSRDEL